MWRLLLVTGGIMLLAILSPPEAAAQSSRCRPSAQVTVGGLHPYLDEPWQFVGGGAVQVCVTRRLSVQPEVAVSPGTHYERLSVVPNVLFDLRDPASDVTPYAIGGIGYGRERDTHIDYVRNYASWYGGIGVRVRMTDRTFAAPEFRLGDDDARAIVGAGYRF